jgi:hypothetical protein
VRGNLHALFGKRPTEKDPAKGTSPAVDFTLRGPGTATCRGYPAMGAATLGQAASDAVIVFLRRPLTWANAVTWPF